MNISETLVVAGLRNYYPHFWSSTIFAYEGFYCREHVTQSKVAEESRLPAYPLRLR